MNICSSYPQVPIHRVRSNEVLLYVLQLKLTASHLVHLLFPLGRIIAEDICVEGMCWVLLHDGSTPLGAEGWEVVVVEMIGAANRDLIKLTLTGYDVRR